LHRNPPAPADRPGMTAEQALDQQDVASGLWDREVSEPAILAQQQQPEGNSNPVPDLGSEHPASAQPRLRPVSVLLPEVVAPEPWSGTLPAETTRKTKTTASPSKQRRSQDRSWRRKVGQILDEYSVAALVGKPAPRLSEPEHILIARKTAAWEGKRPTGPMPLLSPAHDKMDRWDLWEGFEGSGAFTSEGLGHGLRTGPAMGWDKGIDAGNPEHRSVLLQWQERFRPRIIIFTPNTLYWRLGEQTGALELGTGESLETMCEMILKQVTHGDFWAVRAPVRSGLWRSRVWLGLVDSLPSPMIAIFFIKAGTNAATACGVPRPTR
jgi:hypothetical protein